MDYWSSSWGNKDLQRNQPQPWLCVWGNDKVKSGKSRGIDRSVEKGKILKKCGMVEHLLQVHTIQLGKQEVWSGRIRAGIQLSTDYHETPSSYSCWQFLIHVAMQNFVWAFACLVKNLCKGALVLQCSTVPHKKLCEPSNKIQGDWQRMKWMLDIFKIFLRCSLKLISGQCYCHSPSINHCSSMSVPHHLSLLFNITFVSRLFLALWCCVILARVFLDSWMVSLSSHLDFCLAPFWNCSLFPAACWPCASEVLTFIPLPLELCIWVHYLSD